MQSNDELTSEINRLTAERDDWKARCARRVEDIQLQAQRHGQTQSELTKARELLTETLPALDLAASAFKSVKLMRNKVRGYVATPITHNADESCGQDAEADQNTEWEDTFGPDYTGEDAEAAKGCNACGAPSEFQKNTLGLIFCANCGVSKHAAKGGA